MKNKRAELLTENLIFIILNLLFFSVLATFIFIKTTDSSLMEEAYAKKIALILDFAEPEMIISLDMQDAVLVANKEKYTEKIVDIKDNLVTVKLSQKGGYSYSFFNDVSTDKLYFYASDAYCGEGKYCFKIEKTKTEEDSAEELIS